MEVKLKSQDLMIDDIEMDRIYVGSEKYLFYFTTLYVDNIVKEENFRYVCIGLTEGASKVMFKTKEDFWHSVGKFSLRKADFEINEI